MLFDEQSITQLKKKNQIAKPQNLELNKPQWSERFIMVAKAYCQVSNKVYKLEVSFLRL